MEGARERPPAHLGVTHAAGECGRDVQARAAEAGVVVTAGQRPEDGGNVVAVAAAALVLRRGQGGSQGGRARGVKRTWASFRKEESKR